MTKQLTKITHKSAIKQIKLGILFLCLMVSTANKSIYFNETDNDWAKNVLATMTLREKIGQLFMVAAYSNQGLSHQQEIIDLVQNQHIGGLIFFQGGPVRQARLSNEYQKLAKIPLFMAMDAEWGLAMRLDSTVKYPRQMTLGAIQDQTLIYQMGMQIGEQCRRLGMQINFAPVVDVNVNPMNPVIGTRSFGENKEEVSSRAIQYMLGMQETRVLANAKHFPGHGDTDTDSHLAIPIIKHDTSRLNDIELYPFRKIFEAGVKSVMVAHIHIPSIDATPNKPTTLSHNAVTNLLKKEMGFEGLAFTDALNMKGVANYDEPGKTDLMALKAGNDVLLYPMNVQKAIDLIEKSVRLGEISIEDLNAHVLKILEAKAWSKIEECRIVEERNLYEDLNQEKYEALNYKLRASALTILEKNSSFPIQPKYDKKILHLVIGKEAESFETVLNNYIKFDSKVVPKDKLTPWYLDYLDKECAKYDQVILSITDLSNQTKNNFGVTENLKLLVDNIGSKEQNITCHYGNPYSLKHFESCSNLIIAYENHEYSQKAMAQLIAGASGADGRLPVSSGKFKQGDGISVQSIDILGFDFAHNQGLDFLTLQKIDSIVSVAIESKATPGCQVLVAKRGKVVFNKSYGFTAYDKNIAVNNSTIYDLASVTKVLASGMALMKLDNEGKFDINKQLKDYLPELQNTNKGDLYIKDILAHQSGLKPFLPYYANTLKDGKLMTEYYSKTKNEVYSMSVADGVYAKPMLRDSIYKWTNESELLPKEKDGKYPYKYSDVGYYYMLQIIQKLSGMSIEQYLTTEVYDKMNLQRLGYLPLRRHTLESIAPTEKDTYFRNQLVHGYVHDQGAAMMGGIAGHAGLFSNAFDVAQLLQMTLDQGNYNSCKLIDGQLICNYTAKQLVGDNRKGATWDRMRPEGKGSSSDYVSELSYGHSGFTGTLVWVDPDYDLVYVFLSNRVNPDASNNELLKTDVRTKIQDVIYESMLNFNAQHPLYKETKQK